MKKSKKNNMRPKAEYEWMNTDRPLHLREHLFVNKINTTSPHENRCMQMLQRYRGRYRRAVELKRPYIFIQIMRGLPPFRMGVGWANVWIRGSYFYIVWVHLFWISFWWVRGIQMDDSLGGRLIQMEIRYCEYGIMEIGIRLTRRTNFRILNFVPTSWPHVYYVFVY